MLNILLCLKLQYDDKAAKAWVMKMTYEELLILEALHKLHLEAKLNGLAFQAIAINATPDSETAKEFKKMANTSFKHAQIFYKVGLNSIGQNRRQYLGQERRQRQERRKIKLPYSDLDRRKYKR
ncbi:MAG: hypothetical protein WAW61_12825 [Methylococcaceae bacterium]